MIAAVVAPVLQAYEVPPDAVSVAEALEQIIPSLFVVPEVSVTTIAGVGSAFTTIVVTEVPVHPFAFVTVTV